MGKNYEINIGLVGPIDAVIEDEMPPSDANTVAICGCPITAEDCTGPNIADTPA